MENKKQRPKRTKQLTKEELVWGIAEFDNNKEKIADHFKIGIWSVYNQIKINNIQIDGRIASAQKRTIEIPPKEDLIKLYFNENKNMSEIGMIYNVSNVTVNKWFAKLEIQTFTHSETILKKALPKSMITNLKRYGSEHYFSTELAKVKLAKIFTEKYGVPYHPIGNSSLSEIEVLDFMNSLVFGFKKSYIGGVEVDGYNEKINVAFEFNGLYWHKESIKGKELHQKKYNICKNNGIRLFTIFEDEWLKRKSQIKGFITSALNCNNKKVYARNLKFVKLNANDKQALMFLDKYHIQGISPKGNTLNHYALLQKDEIISVMTVGRHHRNNKELVINRCCTKENLTIIGGSKRLFHHIKLNNKNSIIKTWSDNRWTEGNLYQHLGFTLSQVIPKDYSYVSNTPDGRKSKQSMTRTKLGAVDGQSEYERAIELGYDRIWDCGKKTWIYNIE